MAVEQKYEWRILVYNWDVDAVVAVVAVVVVVVIVGSTPSHQFGYNWFLAINVQSNQIPL